MQVIATNGNGSMQENIVDVFGPKQMLHLEEIRWDLEKPLSEEALDHFNIRIKSEGKQINIAACTPGSRYLQF